VLISAKCHANQPICATGTFTRTVCVLRVRALSHMAHTHVCVRLHVQGKGEKRSSCSSG
jgi:hypothetical protein